LNSAQVTRDGIYPHEGSPEDATERMDRVLLVVQEPIVYEAHKFDEGGASAVCDVALLDR
jgi:hypothetical protein